MPLPTPTPTPTLVGSVGKTLIAIQPDPNVVPGQQWLLLTYTRDGQALAEFLTPDWQFSADAQWIILPHNADVDHRLKKLIDLCAAIRLSAPQLVQLELLTGPVEDPRD